MTNTGVSNCFVFKSRLQEYAQKVGLSTPVYETIKEGPSHEPYFRSTVIVNDLRYDSLPGFYNRKAAEQSAAEVALSELAKTGERNASISLPVHEIGLCKNLLQEYALQKNYAIPVYVCQKEDKQGKEALYCCTVDIGGIRYIGASARTKKEAEIKAARTALLAIQHSADEKIETPTAHPHLTVVPRKRKVADLSSSSEQAVKIPKLKKACNKKKFKKRLQGDKARHRKVESKNSLNIIVENPTVTEQLVSAGQIHSEATESLQVSNSVFIHNGETSSAENVLLPVSHQFADSQNGHQEDSTSDQGNNKPNGTGVFSVEDTSIFVSKVETTNAGVEQSLQSVDDCHFEQRDVTCLMAEYS